MGKERNLDRVLSDARRVRLQAERFGSANAPVNCRRAALAGLRISLGGLRDLQRDLEEEIGRIASHLPTAIAYRKAEQLKADTPKGWDNGRV